MIRILIVDDDPDWITQLEMIVRTKEREVLMAESGQQAIRLIQQHDFDIVITDQRMETHTAGLDVLKATKEKDINAQVIVITAYATPHIATEMMRLGAFDYLDRYSSGIDLRTMMRNKIALALEYRQAVTDSTS